MGTKPHKRRTFYDLAREDSSSKTVELIPPDITLPQMLLDIQDFKYRCLRETLGFNISKRKRYKLLRKLITERKIEWKRR